MYIGSAADRPDPLCHAIDSIRGAGDVSRMIRDATPTDLDAILHLENTSFQGDRLSRRSLGRLLRRGRGFTLVDDVDGELRGYVLVLLRSGTSLARLYSIAVGPRWRGKGIAADLVTAAERRAHEEHCSLMRLEVRGDNAASLVLFETLGYRRFGIHEAYYEDAMDAVRLEKRLLPELRPDLARVPYYAQTLDFTCGPAALIMAMQALDAEIQPDRQLELRLWRESTTIFMTSGHGGCAPEGLAIAAHRRGFAVSLYVSHDGPLLLDSVRSGHKRAVIELVHADFTAQVKEAGIPVIQGTRTVAELQEAFNAGAIPVVLISLYRILRQRAPHWVTVTGFDERYIHVHDPWTDPKHRRTATECIHLPIPHADFDRMARYGRSAQRAVLLIERPKSAAPRPEVRS
jgi:ribosomal protein S18 acetylase RimI-like enzyme